jgi:hypothetical protein
VIYLLPTSGSADGDAFCIRVLGAGSLPSSLPLLELMGGWVDVLADGDDAGSSLVASIPIGSQSVRV